MMRSESDVIGLHCVGPVNCGKGFGFHSEDVEKPWYVFKQRHDMI